MAPPRTPPAAAVADQGLVLAPFRGVRFGAARVRDLGAVTSPPYDVIDADDELRLETAEPHNVVRLILPRTPPAPPPGGAQPDRYAHAAATLAAWLADGTLLVDDLPALYVYEQRRDGHLLQRGLVGALGVEPQSVSAVLPHENVVPDLVADRLALMRATRANLEPIFLLYDGGGPASEAVEDIATRGRPAAEADTGDGIRHRLWAVTDPVVHAAVAGDLRNRQALIADGHHRYAAYQRLQREQHAVRGAGPWDRGLALLVDARAYPPDLGAIHRLIEDLPVAAAVSRAATCFAGVRRWQPPDTQEALRCLAAAPRHSFVLAGRGMCALVDRPDRAWVTRTVRARPRPLQDLDATVMVDAVLEDLFGVADEDRRVVVEHHADRAVRAAVERDATAVLLRPPDLADVYAVAAAGERMPRKSTAFGPKPCTGLVLRTFDAG